MHTSLLHSSFHRTVLTIKTWCRGKGVPKLLLKKKIRSFDSKVHVKD